MSCDNCDKTSSSSLVGLYLSSDNIYSSCRNLSISFYTVINLFLLPFKWIFKRNSKVKCSNNITMMDSVLLPNWINHQVYKMVNINAQILFHGKFGALYFLMILFYINFILSLFNTTFFIKYVLLICIYLSNYFILFHSWKLIKAECKIKVVSRVIKIVVSNIMNIVAFKGNHLVLNVYNFYNAMLSPFLI